MWNIKYCGSWGYRPQAERLSASINNMLPDTCQIEEGSKGQYELFRNGESFLNGEELSEKFFSLEDVKTKLLISTGQIFTTRW